MEIGDPFALQDNLRGEQWGLGGAWGLGTDQGQSLGHGLKGLTELGNRLGSREFIVLMFFSFPFESSVTNEVMMKHFSDRMVVSSVLEAIPFHRFGCFGGIFCWCLIIKPCKPYETSRKRWFSWEVSHFGGSWLSPNNPSNSYCISKASLKSIGCILIKRLKMRWGVPEKRLIITGTMLALFDLFGMV